MYSISLIDQYPSGTSTDIKNRNASACCKPLLEELARAISDSVRWKSTLRTKTRTIKFSGYISNLLTVFFFLHYDFNFFDKHVTIWACLAGCSTATTTAAANGFLTHKIKYCRMAAAQRWN